MSKGYEIIICRQIIWEKTRKSISKKYKQPLDALKRNAMQEQGGNNRLTVWASALVVNYFAPDFAHPVNQTCPLLKTAFL